MTEVTPAEGSGEHSPARAIGVEPLSPNMPLLRLLVMAGSAMVLGLSVVSWLAQIGQISLTGYLKAEQNVVYAPRSCRVWCLNAKSGEVVKPRQPLMQLADDR